MREIITDELLEILSHGYNMYVAIIKASDSEPTLTFEQYTEKVLKFREMKTRKALEFINGKK